MTSDAAPETVAAVSWDETGFKVAVRTRTGRPAAQLSDFTTSTVSHLNRYLVELAGRFGDGFACVVDSTDGMIDGGLLGAGIRVHRLDPHGLPPRPVLGSVAASTLAATALRRPELLTGLALQSGSLTGRFAEVKRLVAAAEPALADLAAAGRCLSRAVGPPRTGASLIALTFDDGPHPPYTDAVLDTLARYEVPATFFCVGLHARAHPDLLRRVVDEGHRLANHTWSHPLLADLDRAQTIAQLDRTDEVIDAVRPLSGAPLFRPPYGVRTTDFIDAFTAAAERVLVLWDVEPFDWALPGADTIADRVLTDARPGSIVLLHDGGGDRSQTVEALPRVIEELSSRGYDFVTVDRLLDGA